MYYEIFYNNSSSIVRSSNVINLFIRNRYQDYKFLRLIDHPNKLTERVISRVT